MAKFSIVVPVYNVENYLSECLESLINQTFDDFEVICINDGSTDNSLSVLNDFASKDERFVVISQKNQGQGIARNNALKIVNGQYILFVDPDDWIESNTLEKLYEKFRQTNADIIQFNYKKYNDVSGDSKVIDLKALLKKRFKFDISKNGFYSWKNIKKGCLYYLDLQVWNRAYRNEFIKKHGICFAPSKHGEDHLFTIKSLLFSDKIFFLDEILYNYRIRSGSSVNIVTSDNWMIFDNIRLIESFLRENDFSPELEKEFEQYKIRVLGWHAVVIPKKDREKYIYSCKQVLSEKSIAQFMRMVGNKNSFLENIFSIKIFNDGIAKYKVITILGLHFHLKSKSSLKGVRYE